MKKPLAFLAIALLAGAGWFALHRAGLDRPQRRTPLAESVMTTDAGAREAASIAPWPSEPDPAPPPAADPGMPLAFDYTEASPLADGSFAVEWNFDTTARLRPGDTVRVRLPFSTQPYTAIVLDETGSGGTRRITGRLQDDHGVDSWPFSITLSSEGEYAAANFETGAAHFSVEADANGGRLKDTAAEAARLDNDAVQ